MSTAETKDIKPDVAKPKPSPLGIAAVITAEERRVELSTKEAEIAFSSKGARLLSWKLLGYMDKKGKPMEVQPGGNPIPGPLDIVTGRPDIDARLRNGLFRATESKTGGEEGILFEFSDGTLEAKKSVQTTKQGRAFRLDAQVVEGGVALPARVYWGPGFGQPSEEETSLYGYLPPGVVEIDEAGTDIRLTPEALASTRETRARVIGIENKYFAAILTKEDGTAIEASAGTVAEGKDIACSHHGVASRPSNRRRQGL